MVLFSTFLVNLLLSNTIQKNVSFTENSSNQNDKLTTEPKVFCRYNYQGISKIYNPAYFNNQGEVVFAQSIEEYAKVLGPTWYGVSWCNNNTMVNSIGVYYDISEFQDILKSVNKTSTSSINRNNKIEKAKRDDNSNYLSRDKNNIEEYRESVNKYIDGIYEE